MGEKYLSYECKLQESPNGMLFFNTMSYTSLFIRTIIGNNINITIFYVFLMFSQPLSEFKV